MSLEIRNDDSRDHPHVDQGTHGDGAVDQRVIGTADRQRVHSPDDPDQSGHDPWESKGQPDQESGHWDPFRGSRYFAGQ